MARFIKGFWVDILTKLILNQNEHKNFNGCFNSSLRCIYV